MKYRVLFLTYFGYACIHLLRTAYPFVQLQLAHYYETDSKFIGLLSGVAYIIVGCGYLFHIFFPIKRLLHQYFVEVLLCASFYLLVPIMIFLNIKSPILTLICFGFYGWFQSSCYSVAANMVKMYFDPVEDGCWMGFWGTCSDTGNIIGFFIYTLIIYYLGVSWVWCLVFAPAVTIFLTILIKFLLK